MTERQSIKEEQGVHKDWYREAREMTLDQLPDFVRRLTTTYQHDYGTICHAIAAAAVAACWAVERSPTGGITGFQASCVMWEFCRQWMQWGQEPRRLIDYSNLLYPQYEDKFRTISKETWEWAQTEARRLLQEREGVETVRAHWRLIAAGVVPFDLRVEAT